MSLDIYDGLTIVVGDEGPPGTPAAASGALSFSNGYHPNEVLPGFGVVFPLGIAAAKSVFVSRTKPTALVTFILNRNAVRIGTAFMDPLTCGPGPVFHGSVTLDTPAVSLVAGDLVDWTAPGVADATFVRGECTLGGPPA